MASPMRRERVAEQLRQELSDILQNEVRDPRKGWTTVVRVEMSMDLCHARVYISVLGDEPAKQASLEALERASGFIRGEIGRRMRLRQTPEIRFLLDESIEHSQRIQDVLRDTHIPPPEEEA